MAQTIADADIEFGSAAQAPSASDLRNMYLRDGERRRARATRRGLWIAVLVYILFAAVDVLLIPDVALLTSLTRLVVGATALAVLEVQFRRHASVTVLDRTSALALVLGLAMWMLPALQSSDTASLSYFMIFGAIFMMGANLFFSFPFALSMQASGAILATFLASLLAFQPSQAYVLAFGTFYLSCFVFTCYVNWKLNEERFNVFVNAQEARKRQKEAAERGEALLRMSNTDYLTGLENRRAVDQRLRDYWKDWQQSGTCFAAILLDVDFFKKYNDFYGHQEGDRCLIQIAHAVEEAISPFGATIGRYGGEEFMVLVQKASPERVRELGDIILRTVEQLRVMHDERRDGTSVVTVSVGASMTREGMTTRLEKVVHEADRALYAAKASGRNSAHLFDPADLDSNDECENVTALLKIATQQNLVSLVYQPIEDMKTRRRVGVETLMRLKTPDGAMIPPSLFIPIAERTGMIVELGRWAIRTTCMEMLVPNHAQMASINVSPVQLKQPGFAASVAAILGETGVPGSRIAFEITEGLELDMEEDILQCIHDLKLLGIKIWLDDFGTGFAGLSWLRLIDFDTVKIDRSFLHGSATPRGRAMLHDIVGLIRNRGPRILVEGVETEEQLTLLRKLAIDYAQGYHLGRPAAVEAYVPQDAAPAKVTAKAPRSRAATKAKVAR